MVSIKVFVERDRLYTLGCYQTKQNPLIHIICIAVGGVCAYHLQVSAARGAGNHVGLGTDVIVHYTLHPWDHDVSAFFIHLET